MSRLVFTTILVAILCGVAPAQDDDLLKQQHPDRYIVKKGDTLWDIAGMFLNKPWLWPEIWQINPQVANPHLIYPGDELELIYLDGKPRLRMKAGVLRLSPRVRRMCACNDGRFASGYRIRTLSSESLAKAPREAELIAQHL